MKYLIFTNQYFFIRQAMCGNPQKKLFPFLKLFNLASYYK